MFSPLASIRASLLSNSAVVNNTAPVNTTTNSATAAASLTTALPLPAGTSAGSNTAPAVAAVDVTPVLAATPSPLRTGAPPPTVLATAVPDVNSILRASALRAIDGGLSGAAAMAIQVTSLMWLHTTMNYQYRHGTSTGSALRHLYADGGFRRFYRGYLPSLMQGPLARFGDTAANTGILMLLNSMDATKGLPIALKTVCGSLAAATWRIVLMPLDTVKTMLQVEGTSALSMLKHKIDVGGFRMLYSGALAASSGTLLSHFTWFGTHNYLDHHLPRARGPRGSAQHNRDKLLRHAATGFCSSVCSDTVSNSIRVIKTTKQTHSEPISYPRAFSLVMAQDGLAGVFGRGLKTRIITNGIQGTIFAVLWRYFDERMVSARAARNSHFAQTVVGTGGASVSDSNTVLHTVVKQQQAATATAERTLASAPNSTPNSK